MVKVSPENYSQACNEDLGYCTNCQDFTREMTEPDAEDYDCPECGENTVMGAENALISGIISM